jgi:hypothetical protein
MRSESEKIRTPCEAFSGYPEKASQGVVKQIKLVYF